MSEQSALRITRKAIPASAAVMRHALGSFLAALDLDGDVIIDILTAVGEALANSIEHAYTASAPRDVTLLAQAHESGLISACVMDAGSFIRRADRPDRGFGLRIVRSIASEVALETENGTSLKMLFDPRKMMRRA
jgi:anti-sigma regulatory factor (Ser/Thr protein kinase)